MRVCLTILTLLMLLGVSAGAMTLDERLQFADGLYTRGIHDMAAEEYSAILLAHADGEHVPRVLFRRGECYRQSGDRIAADKDFRRIYTSFPQSEFRFRAGFRRADLYRDAGQLTAASDLYNAVLKEKPPAEIGAACMYFLSETQVDRQMYKEAAATLEAMGKAYPGTEFDSYALLKLGGLYSNELNDPDRAVALFETAAAKPATDRLGAEAVFLLADVLFARKDYEKSAEQFGALLKRYPDDPRVDESRMKAGWAAYYAGRYADALINIDGAPDAAGGDRKDEWLYLRANCERQLLRNAESIETYRLLIETAPASKYAHAARYELALVHYKAGDFAAAVTMARQVDVSGELACDVYWLLAESHAALDNQDEAIQYYRLVTSKFPDSTLAADASYRLAHLLQARGELQAAASYFGKTAQDFPESPIAPKALFASAICLQKLGKHDEAARDWAKLVLDHGDHPLAEESLYQKAMSEMRLERSADATASFRTLLDRYPQSDYRVDALYWRGTLLAQAEAYEDAEAEFRQALKADPRRELEREAKFGLALALYHGDQLAEAADLLSEIVVTPVRERFSGPLLQWLSEYRLQRKEYMPAAAAAQILIDRDNAPVWTQTGWALLGRCAKGRGDGVAARDAFARANAVAVSGPFAAEAALQLGELVQATGPESSEEALLYFQRAAALAGADGQLAVRARAYAGMGEASEALGDSEAAARYYMSVAILYDDPELVPKCLARAADAFASVAKTNAANQALVELRERYPQSEWAKKSGGGNTPSGGTL